MTNCISDATILTIVATICTCVITVATIWARTRPGAMASEIEFLAGKVETMHNTIVSQNATISRQDAQWQGKGGDTHEFSKVETDKFEGKKP